MQMDIEEDSYETGQPETFVEILYVFVEIIEGTPPFSAILIYNLV